MRTLLIITCLLFHSSESDSHIISNELKQLTHKVYKKGKRAVRIGSILLGSDKEKVKLENEHDKLTDALSNMTSIESEKTININNNIDHSIPFKEKSEKEKQKDQKLRDKNMKLEKDVNNYIKKLKDTYVNQPDKTDKTDIKNKLHQISFLYEDYKNQRERYSKRYDIWKNTGRK